jgi:hypothetical protein
MATPVKKPGQGEGDTGQDRTEAKAAVGGRSPQPGSAEESLGEQLLREARAGHAEFVAG